MVFPVKLNLAYAELPTNVLPVGNGLNDCMV